jgi:ribosome-binding factor A
MKLDPDKTPTKKDERIREIVRELAMQFIQRESNQSSLITVTDVMLGDRGKRSTILFTVLPENKQDIALDFLKRQRGDFQEYARTHSRIGRLPLFDFAIDFGEKNRQRADELLN